MPIRVCMVEDDLKLQALMARWLRQEPGLLLVNAYPDAESAVAGIPEDRPDVVLMDINLPGQNGIECVAQLKVKLPATQFAMITVYEDEDKILEALKVGATGYLVKQTPRTEVIAAIRELHGGGSPMTPNIARKVVQSFQRSKPPAAPPLLSDREQQVMDLLAQGYLYKEISASLGISQGSLHTYIRRVYEKLQVHSRAQAMAILAKPPPADALRP
ncbi:MAG: response regulator transcription factor [Verrucomicrobiota bacterium]